MHNIKFALWEIRENEILLRKWSGGAVHLHTFEGPLDKILNRLTSSFRQIVISISKLTQDLPCTVD